MGLVGSGAASSGATGPIDAGTGDSGGAATFTQVYAILSSTTAKCSSCHSPTGNPNGGFVKAKLDLSTQAGAYSNLVGIMSLLTSCKGKTYVVPGQSAMSALYIAIAPNVPTCGAKMPETPGKLTMAEIMIIKAWIDSGAPNN